MNQIIEPYTSPEYNIYMCVCVWETAKHTPPGLPYKYCTTEGNHYFTSNFIYFLYVFMNNFFLLSCYAYCLLESSPLLHVLNIKDGCLTLDVPSPGADHFKLPSKNT